MKIKKNGTQMGINRIQVLYHVSKTKQSIVCNTISMQCFSEFTTSIYQYKSTLLPSASSLTMILTEKTTDMILECGIKEDATSGTEKLLKTLYTMHLCENIHHDICKKLKDMSKISIKI